MRDAWFLEFLTSLIGKMRQGGTVAEAVSCWIELASSIVSRVRTSVRFSQGRSYPGQDANFNQTERWREKTLTRRATIPMRVAEFAWINKAVERSESSVGWMVERNGDNWLSS